jgi:aspartate/methionine/tyrosine aminotransferase
MIRCVTETMGGICGFPRTIDRCPNQAMHRDVVEAQLAEPEPKVTDAMVNAAWDALPGDVKHGELDIEQLRDAIAAALRARDEDRS